MPVGLSFMPILFAAGASGCKPLHARCNSTAYRDMGDETGLNAHFGSSSSRLAEASARARVITEWVACDESRLDKHPGTLLKGWRAGGKVKHMDYKRLFRFCPQ